MLGLRMEMERPPNSACLQACHLSLVVTVVAVVTESAFGRVAQRMRVLVAIWAVARTRRSKSEAQAKQPCGPYRSLTHNVHCSHLVCGMFHAVASLVATSQVFCSMSNTARARVYFGPQRLRHTMRFRPVSPKFCSDALLDPTRQGVD